MSYFVQFTDNDQHDYGTIRLLSKEGQFNNIDKANSTNFINFILCRNQ